jgi:hypothetical protein
MMVWVFLAVVFVWAGLATWAAVRASKRLLQYDELLGLIIDPMQEYRDELSRIATAEGLLHDHPEVVAFHRANMKMLSKIEAAVSSVRENRPQQEPKGLPPKVV